nr:MFS transporter [Wenjunlia tyrosinilytica]
MLRTPGAWRFLFPGFAARLPFAMLTLGIVLLVQHTTGSYGTAGTVAAVCAVAQASAGPQIGRLADRLGQAAVVVPAVVAHTATVGTLTWLALSGAPEWTLYAAAVPAGASVPQIGPMIRSRWMESLGDSPLTGPAFALESVTDELTFVLGPVIATALCTGIHPAAGLVAEAGLTLAGGVAFAAVRHGAPPPARHRAGGRRQSAPAVAGVRLLVLAFLGIGSVFGAMQVSLTAFAEEAGSPGLSGTLYAGFAGGSMVAGAVYGAVRWRRSPQSRMIITYSALVAAASPLWVVHSTGLVALTAIVCGLAVAPTLITGFTLVEKLVPGGSKTEAFTWMTGAIGLGLAAGSTFAGRLADASGSSAGFTVPALGTGLGLFALVALRTRLVPTLAALPRVTVAGSGGTRVLRQERGPVAVD